ncbi:TauD/TfdA family dioxygenase [Phenylobacterium sp. LjRoot225]|uniref:TauD/TfdA dioxygenase family protein n=1 Tax=Phenylobacterium sp. LjRoot225 TaxID=3342285 RepID=UPI003ECD61BF
MGARITHTSLAPFGVEVAIDPSSAVTAANKEELRRLYARDGLLVFRGLDLSMEAQCEFCRIFGPVLDSPYENFYVSNAREDGHLGVLELQWHNDVPYLPKPYLAAALHAIDVVPGATSTQFVSGFRAYERLSPALRERISGLNALQVKQRFSDRSNQLADLQPGDLCTVHSVVRQQEGTGRPYLFVNENMTPLIIGLSPAESDALLQELHSALYVRDDVYEHAWYPGDLVLWDNLAVQHARGRISADKRTLQRVSITDLGYAQQYAADLDIRDAYANAALLTPAA